MQSRRAFIRLIPIACTSVFIPIARADATMVGEKDAQAVALGYVADASKTDQTKFPKYQAGQLCANCSLYQGNATDTSGGCAIFAGKKVAATGWCNLYAKKA